VGVDYVIRADCKVRKKVEENDLIEHQKLATMIAALRTQVGSQVPASDFAKIGFSRMVVTPKGQEQKNYTVESAMKEVNKLEKYEKHCQNCKYNIREQIRGQESPFGCIGSISYPISGLTEEAILHSVLVIMQHDEYRQKYGLILKYVKDHPDVGNRIRALRESPNGGSFFECRECLSVEFNGEVYTSDQLLEVLIGFDITPAYAKILHHPFYNIFYNVVMKSHKSDVYKADTSTRQFLIYGNGFGISATENVPMQVRM